jgi:hypothetical protein
LKSHTNYKVREPSQSTFSIPSLYPPSPSRTIAKRRPVVKLAVCGKVGGKKEKNLIEKEKFEGPVDHRFGRGWKKMLRRGRGNMLRFVIFLGITGFCTAFLASPRGTVPSLHVWNLIGKWPEKQKHVIMHMARTK